LKKQYLDAYILAISTSGTLADEAAIQTLLTFTATCETVKAMAGSEDVKNLTLEMLDILGIENVFAIIFTEAYYSDAIFELDTLENCVASIQEVIDATNFLYIQEMAEFEYADELTNEMLIAVGVENVNPDLMDDYKTAVGAAGTIADLAALQAIIDAVNEANEPAASVTLNVKMKHWTDLGKFVPATDFVDVAGSFNNWGDPQQKLTAVEPADDHLTYTITIEDLEVDVEYSFKFRINGSWDNDKHEFPNDGPARKITLVEGANEFTYWFNDEDPTSVNDEIHAGLKLYPNPAKETLTITSAVTISEIRMINSIGQVVFSDRIDSDNARIPVQRFENGIYLVQVVTSAGIAVERVMINH
jgi:hypothetical protein